MKKIYILFLMAITIAAVGSAQNRSSLVKYINDIKSQADTYYWAQYTHPDADTAKYNATKWLLCDINPTRNENSILTVEEVMPYAKYVNIDRGNLKQCFVYIRKEESEGITKKTKGNLSEFPVVLNPTTPNSNVMAVPKTFVPDAIVQRIMETGDFMSIYRLLQSMQSQGQILQFGKLRDVDDYSSLDLILFDMKSQKVITILSPLTDSGVRINSVDGSQDALDNYPRELTAVIWYIKK